MFVLNLKKHNVPRFHSISQGLKDLDEKKKKEQTNKKYKKKLNAYYATTTWMKGIFLYNDLQHC